MAAPSVEELWRRTLDANVRYSRAVGVLATDYVRALAALAGDLLPRTRDTATMTVGPRTRASPASPPTDAAPPATMVLEAGSGEIAVGAFVVENALDHPVETVVVASPFARSDGASVVVPIAYDPPAVTLEPGQQVVVRVGVTIGAEMDVGSDYRGELAVPDLPGTHIPVVVRRRAAPRRRTRAVAVNRSG